MKDKNLQLLFNFTQADLQLNQQKQISISQKIRLSTAFYEDFRLAFLRIAGSFVMTLFFTTLSIGLLNVSYGTLLGIFIMWGVSIAVQWHNLFGKHNIRYLNYRLKNISKEPIIKAKIVYRDDFDFRDLGELPDSEARFGDIYGPHPYYGHWIQSFSWYKTSDLPTHRGWYKLNSENIELYITDHQFDVLEVGIAYDFYCFVDIHDVAYVLSVNKNEYHL